MFMSILYTCMYVLHVELELTDGYESLCGYWKLNIGSLQEQPVLLITESFYSPN